MNYESAVVLLIVFSIPAGIFLATRFIRLRQQAKFEQGDFEQILAAHEKASGPSVF